MNYQNISTGKAGELFAANYLKRNGFKILVKNFRYGKTEIDIIAEKKGKIHFIEVKTRNSIVKGKPFEAVRARKISHLITTATFFLLQSGKKDHKLSLDVISILLERANKIKLLQHFENINS